MLQHWWVNHDKTHAFELSGGYIWCPKRNKANRAAQTYTNLTLVERGDTVFSYAAGAIQAIGIVSAEYREAQRPEYAGKGEAWQQDGWQVPLTWTLLQHPLDPAPHFEQLKPLLPTHHSPLNRLANGAQNVYLGAISGDLARMLLTLAGAANPDAQASVDDAKAQQDVLNDPALSSTTKKQLVDARMGQGVFRQRVARLGARCRVSGTDDGRLLVASHIKPWSQSSNEERLDGNNGLMLAPHVDRLFDRFLIPFQDDGRMVTAGPKVVAAMKAWGLNPEAQTPALRPGQRKYMAYHRNRLSEVAAKNHWS